MKKHLIDDISIPDSMQRVLNYINESTPDYLEYYERAHDAAGLLYDLSPAVLFTALKQDETEIDLAPELNKYYITPFELIPFSYNGGDGLHYSWVNLAPELEPEDYLCVSYAPGESAVWLGDNTSQALCNLMLGKLRAFEEWKNVPKAPDKTQQWRKLIAVIGKAPDYKEKITPGARSTIKISPVIPSGWNYEPTDDGIGVLADKKYFSNSYSPIPSGSDYQTYQEQIERYLNENKAATALVILKQARQEMCYDDSDQMNKIVELFMEAYRQLNRKSPMKRAEIWLQKSA